MTSKVRNTLLKTAFITDNAVYSHWANRFSAVKIFKPSDLSLQNNYGGFECLIIEMPFPKLSLRDILKQFGDCHKILAISSVPYKQLPATLQQVISSYKIKFALMPITPCDIFNEIQIKYKSK